MIQLRLAEEETLVAFLAMLGFDHWWTENTNGFARYFAHTLMHSFATKID